MKKAKKFDKRAEWRKRNPWARYVEYARRRCTDPEHRSYPSHGAKGIKVFLDADAAAVLWKRDKADLLKKPSLDRIQSDKHYCVHNCRFIEHDLNSRLPHDASLRAEDRDDPSWLHEDPPEFV